MRVVIELILTIIYIFMYVKDKNDGKSSQL